ncbi:MAG: CRTAC1 family protein [Acidobacteriota bacterium]
MRRRTAWAGLLAMALLGRCGPGAGGGEAATGAAMPAGVSVPPAAATPGPTGVWFTDVARDAGLSFRHVAGDPVDKRAIYESNAAGCAWLDADGDGRMDLYLVNSGHRLRTTPPPEDERTSGALFHNDGDGTFSDVTAAAGLTDWRWGMGAAVGDVDNDGDVDLYVTHVGPNALWINDGTGVFTDEAALAGVDDDGPGSGAAFGDVDGDGWLDLYVANYVAVTPDVPLPGSDELCTYRGMPVYCGPKGLPTAPDRLFRNTGHGRFVDVSDTSGIRDVAARHSFDVAIFDVEPDGDADIYVAVDAAPSLLFIGDGRGHFAERAMFAGVALAEAGTPQAGMGIDTGDWDGDGLIDLVKSNFEGEVFNLYVNSPGGLFSDRAHLVGLGRSMPALGWGTLLFDVDRDGWLDLFFADGHVYPGIVGGGLQIDYAQQNLLFLTRPDDAGRLRLEDVSDTAGPGLRVRKVSRGAAFADYDADGDLDLALNNSDDTPDLLRNDSRPAGRWLSVRTVGTRSNRDGYGARVRVTAAGRTWVRQVHASRGYLSSSDPAAFFGLGPVARIERLEVVWPGGRRETFPAPDLDRQVTVREGDGTPI